MPGDARPARVTPFREADVVRALRAAKRAGIEIGSIEIAGGRVVLRAKDCEPAGSGTPLDEWLKEQSDAN